VEGVGRMMGQWGIYFEIIQHFAETNQFFYDELIRNLKEEEVDNVVEMLHRFKGISASISANELSALLAEIEKEMRERGAIGQSQLENLKRAFETVMTSIASARTI
jgi:HPt (histidine-containing phosphotransfer) domain-containing protein